MSSQVCGGGDDDGGVTVLSGLAGDGDKTNDVFYVPAATAAGATEDEPGGGGVFRQGELLVYFGGDVQDYESRMLSHRDNHVHAGRSLERTAKMLSEVGGGPRRRHVAVIRAQKMELGTFSRYSNFVQSNNFGVPTHDASGRALDHLRALMLSLQSKFPECRASEADKILVGFSKGVVVLNQLLHSFHWLSGAEDRDELLGFAKTIRKMVWLDGGHNGGKETWVIDPQVLATFSSMGIAADVRVTPYQVRDTRRPWIGKEEKRFVAGLRRAGANVRRELYFEDEPASIEKHFQVLDTLGLD